MSSVTQRQSDIDGLVAQLHATADITDLTLDNRDKLLNAARHLTIALETPVYALMTIAKWVSTELPVTAELLLDPKSN